MPKPRIYKSRQGRWIVETANGRGGTYAAYWPTWYQALAYALLIVKAGA